MPLAHHVLHAVGSFRRTICSLKSFKKPRIGGSFDSEKYFKNQDKRFLNVENIREPKRGYETLKIMKKLKPEILCFL